MRLYGSISLKGGKKVGDDVGRDEVAVSGRDVAQAEHQERQQEKQAAKWNLSQIVPKVSLDMLKAPSHVVLGAGNITSHGLREIG